MICTPGFVGQASGHISLASHRNYKYEYCSLYIQINERALIISLLMTAGKRAEKRALVVDLLLLQKKKHVLHSIICS